MAIDVGRINNTLPSAMDLPDDHVMHRPWLAPAGGNKGTQVIIKHMGSTTLDDHRIHQGIVQGKLLKMTMRRRFKSDGDIYNHPLYHATSFPYGLSADY